MKKVYSLFQNITKFNILNFFLLVLFLSFSKNGSSQTSNGVLKGYVIDGSTNKKIPNAKISHSRLSVNSIYKNVETNIDGSYILETDPETYSVTFSVNGFQTKKIGDVIIKESYITYLDVVLYPISNENTNITNYSSSNDSLNFADSVKPTNYLAEQYSIANLSRKNALSFHSLSSETIEPGMDKNASYLLKRLNGLVVLDNPNNQQLQNLTVRGLGQRYNQVMLNGALLNSFNATSNAYPLDFIPTEAVENVSLNKNADPHLPADFSGGSVSINTKEFPEKDFMYALGGVGLSQYTIGK